MVKYYPNEIKRLETRIEGYKKDIELAGKNTPNSNEKFQSMTIKGITYTDKKEAGDKILELCKNIRKSEKQEIGVIKVLLWNLTTTMMVFKYI